MEDMPEPKPIFITMPCEVAYDCPILRSLNFFINLRLDPQRKGCYCLHTNSLNRSYSEVTLHIFIVKERRKYIEYFGFNFFQ